MIKKNNIIASNKKAEYNYFLEKKYSAGIKLLGLEIKSIRLGNVSIQNSYISIKNDEVFIINMLITKYEFSYNFYFEEDRPKKLLLTKNEIFQIKNKIKIERLTVIPLKLYFNRHLAKIEIALARGKKKYDKRNVLKEKALKYDVTKNCRVI